LEFLLDHEAQGAPTEHDNSAVCPILERDPGTPGSGTTAPIPG
jgi:hypothetical protein